MTNPLETPKDTSFMGAGNQLHEMITALETSSELDEILEQHREWMRGIRTDRLVGTNHEQTKAAIERLIAEEVRKQTPVTIMGKSLDEVCVILSALELERIADMKMTMARLDDWVKLLREDYREAMEKATSRAFATLTNTESKDE